MEKWIYLDNNASTKVAPEVMEEMLPYFDKLYGNPSSMHAFGGQVKKEIEKARESIAELINANPDEIIFTSCATESNNTVFNIISELFPTKKHIITTAVEHSSVYYTSKKYEKKGYKITYLGVNKDGQIDLEELKNAISDDTALVSIMWANNETGVIFPIKEIAEIVKEKGVLFHTDAVQAAGKVEIDLKNIPADYLSLSGHKFHAPKGVGILYIRKNAPFVPFITGGHHENNMRAGTYNAASIIGMGKAAKLAKEFLKREISKIKYLRDKLEKGIKEKIKAVSIHGENSERLPNTTNIGFKYIEGESILLRLSEKKIAASAGSACLSDSLEPSHVLTAMQVPADELHGSVRFSLSRYNTEEEIDYILEILPEIVKNLRELSPLCPPDVR